MANRAVTLYLRIKTPEGKKPYCKPVFLTKGRLKPLYAFVDGEPEHCSEGVYSMRFGAVSGKQQLWPLGNDPYWALDKVAEKERWLRDRERGMVTPIPENPKQESAPIDIVLELDELPFSGTMESLSIIMQNAPIEC